MGLFSRKKVADSTTAVAVKGTTARATDRDLSGVLVRPHITEKAMRENARNVYTFIVHPRATKRDVMDALTAHYKVTPVAVRVVNRAPALRHVGSRNRLEKMPGQKKAYVTLKQGESISLV
jgi:large subunit ribosomal protein L23